MATFKDRFKELRLEKGLSQKEMGDILGFTEAAMSMYEAGKREPRRSEDFIKIADYFNVTLDYLMGRVDERDTLLVHDIVDGEDIEIGVDRAIYPGGLTHEQVIEILESLNSKFNKSKEK